MQRSASPSASWTVGPARPRRVAGQVRAGRYPKMSLTRSNRPRRLGRRPASARTVPWAATLASCSSSFFCSLVSFFGVITFTVTRQVAAAASGDVRHAASAQRGTTGPVSRALGTLNGSSPSSVGNPDLAAERERREVERHLAVEVVAVALEERMVLHVDDDVEVARRTARASGFAFAGQTQPLAGGDAGRNAHRELALLLHAAGALAGRARLRDDRSGAAALTARARDGEEALLIAKLAAALALRTGRRLRAGRRAGAAAGLARLLPRESGSTVSVPLAASSNEISRS